MPHPPIRSWICLSFLSALTAVAVARYALRPAAPQPASVEVLGPCPAAVGRQRAKERIALDVIGGRLSLAEAAAAFEALDRDAPPQPKEVKECLFPGASEQEAYRLMVLSWVRVNAPPGQADALTRRLQAEPDHPPPGP